MGGGDFFVEGRGIVTPFENPVDDIPLSTVSEMSLRELYKRSEGQGLHIPFRLLIEEVAQSAEDVLSQPDTKKGKRSSKKEKSNTTEREKFLSYISEFQTFPEGILSNQIGLKFDREETTPSHEKLENYLATLALYDERGITPPWWVSYNIADAYYKLGDYQNALGYLEDIDANVDDTDINNFLKEFCSALKAVCQFYLSKYMECAETVHILLKIPGLEEADTANLYFMLFRCYVEENNVHLAYKSGTEALKLQKYLSPEEKLELHLLLHYCDKKEFHFVPGKVVNEDLIDKALISIETSDDVSSKGNDVSSGFYEFVRSFSQTPRYKQILDLIKKREDSLGTLDKGRLYTLIGVHHYRKGEWVLSTESFQTAIAYLNQAERERRDTITASHNLETGSKIFFHNARLRREGKVFLEFSGNVHIHLGKALLKLRSS